MGHSARKSYVLDTSVLLSSPKAMLTFEEHEVIIPLVVVKELEGKRNDPELGLPARQALRLLEDLRRRPDADLRKGVVINDLGGTVRIETNHVDRSGLPDGLREDKSNDTRILAVSNALANEGHHVVLISKDLPMRILAQGVLGIPAEEYRREQVQDSGYTGIVTVDTDKSLIDALYADGAIDFEDDDVPVNTGVILKAGSSSALARVTRNPEGGRLLVKVRPDEEAFGMHGRSAEQRIALAHLLDPEIGIVSLGGNAGTGKSLIALAAALEAVLERRQQRRIVVFRPLYAVGGQDLGYLPGTEAEKMGPWGAAVFDALRAISGENVIDEVLSRNILEVLPLTHIRGRTFTDTIMIIDEAQNLERMVLLTALTRVGDNSRVFLTHDIGQRDNLRVGRHDGVAAVVERFKDNDLFAHTTLTRSERSAVAALATRVLDNID